MDSLVNQLLWVLFGEIFHIREYFKKNKHIRQERLRHHISLGRRYRRWKRDKKRKRKHRRAQESSSDDNNEDPPSPSVKQPLARNDTDLIPPAYNVNNQLLEQQLHQQHLENMNRRSQNLYGHQQQLSQYFSSPPSAVNYQANQPSSSFDQPTTLPRASSKKTSPRKTQGGFFDDSSYKVQFKAAEKTVNIERTSNGPGLEPTSQSSTSDETNPFNSETSPPNPKTNYSPNA